MLYESPFMGIAGLNGIPNISEVQALAQFDRPIHSLMFEPLADSKPQKLRRGLEK